MEIKAPSFPKAPTVERLEPDFAEVVGNYRQAPSPQRAGAYLKTVSPIIDEGVRVYGGPHASPLLRSHARRMALDALPNYDPQRSSLKTHLMHQFRRLQRIGPQIAQGVSVPEGVAIDRRDLRDSEMSLADELGRDPSDAELADRTGLSMGRIAKLRAYRPALAEGEYAARAATEEGEGGDPAVARLDDHTKALAEFLYDDVDPVNQLILEHTLGLRGAPVLPHKEIARRAGVSPGAISQRLQQLQGKLDRLGDAELI